MSSDQFIISPDDKVLITGAAGFIGSRVVKGLLNHGFRNLVCFTRHSSDGKRIDELMELRPSGAKVGKFEGNLLSRADCEAACEGVSVIFHLAAGTGEKSYPDAYMNSVVATRNLLDASLKCGRLTRLLLVSSFAVYTNRQGSRMLDESCPVEQRPELRGDAYCYAKVKQEQILAEYGRDFGVPYVIVRPGSVYGEGRSEITGRIGLGTFCLFLHLGGLNTVPFTYVENCADAIVLAGLVRGVDGEAFNVVDDDLPPSRQFLHQYKKAVGRFRSIYIPHAVSYSLCCLWEKYSYWSYGQLPLAFTRGRWYSEWKSTRYSNKKLKDRLGWKPKISTPEAMRLYLSSCVRGKQHA